MLANPKNEALFLSLVEAGELVVEPDGTVMNAITEKVYSRGSRKGHIHIAKKLDGKVYHILAHRLVYLWAVGPLAPHEQVMHIDGDPRNNDPSNLAKTDNAGNVQHAYALGKIDRRNITRGLLRYFKKRNRPHWNAKLTAEQVNEIRTRFAAGAKKKHLAREFNIDRSTIIGIVRGELYRSIPMH